MTCASCIFCFLLTSAALTLLLSSAAAAEFKPFEKSSVNFTHLAASDLSPFVLLFFLLPQSFSALPFYGPLSNLNRKLACVALSLMTCLILTEGFGRPKPAASQAHLGLI